VIWIVVFLVGGIVCAIAAVFVFREAIRLHEEPPDAVFDPDDALAWVVRHLDDLTEHDARRIIDAQMEFLRGRGVTHDGDPTAREVPVVFAADEAVEYVTRQCAASGEAYLPEQVEAVIACQMDYLRFIGAVGGPADEDA
jgi:hypothetical protein